MYSRPEIETIPDNIADCEAKGGVWIVKETRDRSLLNMIGIGEPTIIVEEYCDMDRVNWVLWIFVGLAVLMIIIFNKKLIAWLQSLWKITLGRFL